MNTIKITNLQTLFELRKTKGFSKRICTARLFFYEGKWGLCDSSCFLWPVCFEHGLNSEKPVNHTELKQGDVITFSSEFIYKFDKNTEETGSPNVNQKYDDLHYILKIEEIKEHVACLDDWKNPIIPNPIPNLSLCSLKDDQYTCYYTSPTKSRFRLIASRMKALERVKLFFGNRDFLAIESPSLVPSGAMETYLNPFCLEYTDHRQQKITLQLPTSPEFALKKILAEGTAKIFQISRSYRNNGELSRWHEPEFFMLEWYRIGANLKDILSDTQNLIMTLADFLGSSLDLPKHWPRYRVDELFQTLLKLDLNKLQNKEDFFHNARPLSPSVVATDTWDDIFCKLFMEKIEPFLKEQKACFVTHYPAQMAALAALENEGPFAQRAEAFVYGVEICNAYLELVDAQTLQTRIEKTKQLKPDLQEDPLFENAMRFGLPSCAGNALGLDRVIALLLGIENIANLYPIPFLAQFLQDRVAKE